MHHCTLRIVIRQLRDQYHHYMIHHSSSFLLVRSGKDMLCIARPFTSVPLFDALEKLHASVVRGPDGNDGQINILTLKWTKTNWPWAEIEDQAQGALITGVCSSSA